MLTIRLFDPELRPRQKLCLRHRVREARLALAKRL